MVIYLENSKLSFKRIKIKLFIEYAKKKMYYKI